MVVQCENKVKHYKGTPEVFQFDTNLLFACDENHPRYTKYLQDVRFLAKRGHELPQLQISMSFVLLLLRTPPTCMFNCSIVSQNFFDLLVFATLLCHNKTFAEVCCVWLLLLQIQGYFYKLSRIFKESF